MFTNSESRLNLLIIFLIVACLAGCGGSSSSPDTVIPTPIEPPDEPPPTTPTPSEPNNEKPPVNAPGDSPGNGEFEGLVDVTFSVQVPDNTPPEDRLYVTGDFENWSGGGDPEYELMLVNDTRYQLTLPMDAGSTIQFKITRGSWSKEESSDLGRVVGNRTRRILGEDLTFNELVPGWIDLIDAGPNPFFGFWNTPTPDYRDNESRPTLTLIGNHVLVVNPGERYSEPGATATDTEDGDLTGQIQISGDVDEQKPGDYLLSYTVADSDNNLALGKTRIIRVLGDVATSVSFRPVGQSLSHLGYAEQLPADYGLDPDKKYPLLIYHHGGRGDASSLDDSPFNSLNRLFSLGGGPATIALQGGWDTDSPLIAFSPQRSELSPPNIGRIDAFVDYAIHHYQIDPDRIYMTGHSQGGFVSWRYAVEHPDKVAAIAPLAGGFFAGGIPDNLCDAAVVPIWAFHSVDDNVVSANTGRAPINLINDCAPAVEPRFTLFDGLGHQSHQYVLTLQGMGNALASDYPFEQNLYEWFMQQNIGLRQ